MTSAHREKSIRECLEELGRAPSIDGVSVDMKRLKGANKHKSTSSGIPTILREVNLGVGGGRGASNMVGGYAYDPTKVALEVRFMKMESRMEEMYKIFSTLVNTTKHPNPLTNIIPSFENVMAPIEVQHDKQQADTTHEAPIIEEYRL